MTRNIQIDDVLQVLFQSWSNQTSTLWKPDNPALGQCGVTALVVHDLLGGEILKTETNGAWHFYNRIDGDRQDFTASQFPSAIEYSDIPSNRDEAFMDTNASQYRVLKSQVFKLLGLALPNDMD